MSDKVNTHHLFYPRAWFRRQGGVAWEFYQLPCNQVRLPVAIHDELHHGAHITVMPGIEFMTYRVWLYKHNRCGCEHHVPAVVLKAVAE